MRKTYVDQHKYRKHETVNKLFLEILRFILTHRTAEVYINAI